MLFALPNRDQATKLSASLHKALEQLEDPPYLAENDEVSRASFCTGNSMNECHGPLVMASTYGHVDCTRYLVEVLNADIEEQGIVFLRGKYMEGMRPLWCAVKSGNIVLVKYLLFKGAQVNIIHELCSTPINAACQLGCPAITKVLVEHGADIEITDKLGSFCMMTAAIRGHIQVVRYLISIGVDVNKKNYEGETTLYKCAELGHLELVKMLLDNHANMDADSSGITPLLAAASGGHIQVVEYLFGQMALTAEDGINVYQVLGAALFDKKRDIDSAMKYWRLAMRERVANGPSNRQETESFPAFLSYKEVETQEELEEIKDNIEELDVQSLLVKARVLGLEHNDTSFHLHMLGTEYSMDRAFNLSIELWMHTLNMTDKKLKALDPRRMYFLRSLTEVFSDLIDYELSGNEDLIPLSWHFESFLRLFDMFLGQVEAAISHQNEMSSYLAHTIHMKSALPMAMHLTFLLKKAKSVLSADEVQLGNSRIQKLARLKPRDIKGRTLLHMACSKGFSLEGLFFEVDGFPNLDVVNSLIENGADPNVKDHGGNTPLHSLAKSGKSSKEIIDTLLSAGTHFDTLNGKGKSFASIMADLGQDISDLVDPMLHISLQCLAANCIRKHRIPYKDSLSPVLSQFVDSH
ncbi:protein fem-1 homolog A-like [Palaemon carinicauda]|uniref:protein fem-1 homolog A-like n=1 Tax=Palaemon carinicauda TaxID=392227 RepID=UPI0035B675F5